MNDDLEVAELRRRFVALSTERQAQALDGVLTPELRLRVLVGKSTVSEACVAVLKRACAVPNSMHLWFECDTTVARHGAWRAWKQLMSMSGQPGVTNETRMRTTFDNGACVSFHGTDEASRASVMGLSLDRGTVVYGSTLYRRPEEERSLRQETIPPMLHPTSVVVEVGL